MSETEAKNPFQTIVLENAEVHVEILPGYGAKISSLRSTRAPETEWLWTNPTLSIDEIDLNGPFDDNFYGGIDELFPSDLPTEVLGTYLPDHGELWRRAWRVDEVTDTAVTLSVRLNCVPVHATRHIHIKGRSMLVETVLENMSDTEIPFLWVSHPAFQIDESCELYIPSGSTVVQDERNGRVPKGTDLFKWPGTELQLNLNRIPSVGDALESYYILDVPEGKFKVIHQADQEALEVHFSIEQFPHVWLFLPLGGWRGHTLAIVEAASGYPTDLAEAIEMDTHSVIPPRGRVAADMAYTFIKSETATGGDVKC